MLARHKTHIKSHLVPQLANLSFLESLSLIANHVMKEILGMALVNHTIFHQVMIGFFVLIWPHALAMEN